MSFTHCDKCGEPWFNHGTGCAAHLQFTIPIIKYAQIDSDNTYLNFQLTKLQNLVDGLKGIFEGLAKNGDLGTRIVAKMALDMIKSESP